ncbi:EthD domain-containing protein [Gordonia westfalica]|uniref:EthD domain-containing protein n=1 Tax=Gordonia westfalica TaxID=158898 RepID=A0ABU2GPC6_9ACTN|nr:EthD domain-containing protein [Gordonia westfalica]MDS1113312.1 EthD domain-containing protein [Gordonia westfalica]
MTHSKVIAAVRSSELSRDNAAALVEVCSAAGSVRVQVNISDEPVSSAMRIDQLDPPIVAVVTVWAADPGAVVTALESHLDGAIAAWEVTERTPLNPPIPADGTRVDALSNIAFLRRPVDLDRNEWLSRWLDDHTQVAIDTQSTFGYVQNVVERPLTDDTPVVDGIVEELFPMAAVSDIHAFYGSAGDQAELERRMTLMLNSIARFGADRDLDVVPTSRYDFDLGGRS